MMRHFAVLATVGLALGGPVLADDQPAAAPRPACAFTRSIDNWKVIDEETIYLYSSPQTRFKVTFFAPCRETKWAVFARVDARPRGKVCLSAGDALIFGRESPFSRDRLGLEERCVIKSIELAPEAAEPPKTP